MLKRDSKLDTTDVETIGRTTSFVQNQAEANFKFLADSRTTHTAQPANEKREGGPRDRISRRVRSLGSRVTWQADETLPRHSAHYKYCSTFKFTHLIFIFSYFAKFVSFIPLRVYLPRLVRSTSATLTSISGWPMYGTARVPDFPLLRRRYWIRVHISSLGETQCRLWQEEQTSVFCLPCSNSRWQCPIGWCSVV